METLFENEFAIVVCVKNESPYIGEFVDYHYRIGVDKFYIYDNDSDDRAELQKILEPWIQSKIVEYVELPERHAQMIAYNDALDKHRFDCKYFCVLDADEFLVPKNNRGLVEIVDAIFKLPLPPKNLSRVLDSIGECSDQMDRIAS